MDFFGIGAMELVMILLVAIIAFGPGKLPEIARTLGQGIRKFRMATTELSKTLSEEFKEVKEVKEDLNKDLKQAKKELEEETKGIGEELKGDMRGIEKEVAEGLKEIEQEAKAGENSGEG